MRTREHERGCAVHSRIPAAWAAHEDAEDGRAVRECPDHRRVRVHRRLLPPRADPRAVTRSSTSISSSLRARSPSRRSSRATSVTPRPCKRAMTHFRRAGRPRRPPRGGPPRLRDRARHLLRRERERRPRHCATRWTTLGSPSHLLLDRRDLRHAPEPVTEDSPKEFFNPYGGSEVGRRAGLHGLGRARARTSAGKQRRCLTIRPTVTFGPNNFANMYSLIRQIHSRQVPAVRTGYEHQEPELRREHRRRDALPVGRRRARRLRRVQLDRQARPVQRGHRRGDLQEPGQEGTAQLTCPSGSVCSGACRSTSSSSSRARTCR
jgi:hypothetical protein